MAISYGSIKKLSGNRRRPYAAYPPTTQWQENGSPVSVPAIGYFEDYFSALDALREYNKNPYDIITAGMTFSDVYEQFFDAKYNQSRKALSKQTMYATQAAYQKCGRLYSVRFKDIRKADMQKIVDECPLKRASVSKIIILFHEMYKFAMENDIVDKDYSRFVQLTAPDDNEKGEPFSQEEIDLLWQNKNAPGVDTILIMIYSGFRIIEYKEMEYNLTDRYMRGGVKTKSSKDRVVPIHSAIYDIIAKYSENCFYSTAATTYRRNVFYPALERLGISTASNGTKHTPHDCRHTFSWLCDKYKVDDLSKHLMMGHTLGGDVEKSVYGHRTLEELRAEIEKIKI